MCGAEADPFPHIPVLFQETLEGLGTRPGGKYIDATVGGGGHAEGLLAASAPRGRVLGIDRDPSAVDAARRRLALYGRRVVLVHGSFALLGSIAHANGYDRVDGVLFDLGLSSYQLADPSRGFAFAVDGPLDMRFDLEADTKTAADLVNGLPLQDLAQLIRCYGEDRQASRIARAIVASRPVESTGQLADIVCRAVPRRRGRVHPATQTFQALRIAVNGELDAISEALPQAGDLLVPGGRLVVISFHSLEDRLVKQYMKRDSRNCICPPEVPVCQCEHVATLRVITRQPIRPTLEEVQMNRRARSAKLRIAERLAAQANGEGE